LAGFDQKNINSPLFGYANDPSIGPVIGEGTPAQDKALFAVAPNTDWYGVGDTGSAVVKASVQDCANYAVMSNGDGFIYHGKPEPFHPLLRLCC
jgi:hypothetical protein